MSLMSALKRMITGPEMQAVPDLGRNELGDVARRLTDLAAFLRDQEMAIAAEEEETRRLLLSALPHRIVARLGTGGGESIDDVGEGRIELGGETVSRKSAVVVDADLPRDVDVAPSGGNHCMAEAARRHHGIRRQQLVSVLHRPFQSGGRSSVKAAWNSRWSFVVISKACVIASSSIEAARPMSISLVSRSLVAR